MFQKSPGEKRVRNYRDAPHAKWTQAPGTTEMTGVMAQSPAPGTHDALFLSLSLCLLEGMEIVGTT